MSEASVPKGIISPYKDFQEILGCHNTLPGCIGQPYKKVASIPHGDPYSMMIIALLLRPWVLQTEGFGREAKSASR